MKRAQWQQHFERLPTGLTISAVAKSIGKPYRITAKWIRILGYKRASGHGKLWTEERKRQYRRVPWHFMDWTMTNANISRTYKVSREMVRRRRIEFHATH